MIDERGDVWITTFTSAWKKFSQMFSKDPRGVISPSTVLKLSLKENSEMSGRKYGE